MRSWWLRPMKILMIETNEILMVVVVEVFSTVLISKMMTVGVGHSRSYCNAGCDQSQGRRPLNTQVHWLNLPKEIYSPTIRQKLIRIRTANREVMVALGGTAIPGRPVSRSGLSDIAWDLDDLDQWRSWWSRLMRSWWSRPMKILMVKTNADQTILYMMIERLETKILMIDTDSITIATKNKSEMRVGGDQRYQYINCYWNVLKSCSNFVYPILLKFCVDIGTITSNCAWITHIT